MNEHVAEGDAEKTRKGQILQVLDALVRICSYTILLAIGSIWKILSKENIGLTGSSLCFEKGNVAVLWSLD